MTWLDNKIYVVNNEAQEVQVYSNEAPFGELKEEEIKIKDMERPYAMQASQVSRSIHISDGDSRCIWSIQMPEKTISKLEVDGRPLTLSITPSNELLVVVYKRPRFQFFWKRTACRASTEPDQSHSRRTSINSTMRFNYRTVSSSSSTITRILRKRFSSASCLPGGSTTCSSCAVSMQGRWAGLLGRNGPQNSCSTMTMGTSSCQTMWAIELFYSIQS